MIDISPQELLDLRLQNQRISQSYFRAAGDVISWLGAAQAQDFLGAKWSLGLRIPGAKDADIEAAIADRSIVRTTLQRGTLHFTAACDVRWMLKLAAPRVLAKLAGSGRSLGLDAAVLARSRDILLRELTGGRSLTRKEVQSAWESNGIEASGQRGSHLFYHAALDGLICHGCRRGNEFCFVLLDEWVTRHRSLEGDEAVAELAKRYFASHGPATVQDFAWWSGQTLSAARGGLEAVKDNLSAVKLNNETYWIPQPQPNSSGERARAYLLPGFDEYMLGYMDRTAAIPAEQIKALTPENGVFAALVVVDGHVAGTWKRAFGKNSVAVSISSFRSLTSDQHDAVMAAVARYGSFLDVPITY